MTAKGNVMNGPIWPQLEGKVLQEAPQAFGGRAAGGKPGGHPDTWKEYCGEVGPREVASLGGNRTDCQGELQAPLSFRQVPALLRAPAPCCTVGGSLAEDVGWEGTCWLMTFSKPLPTEARNLCLGSLGLRPSGVHGCGAGW